MRLPRLRRDQDETGRDLQVATAETSLEVATGETYETSETGAWYRRDGVATRSRRVATWILLAGVMVAVAAMSWSGLFHWFTGPVHWSQGHALLGPAALDAAAIVSAGFAMDRIEKGETGAQFRMISAVLVALSAFINWRGALGSGNVGEELFFPVMSVVVYWIFHAVMGAVRRDVGREQHGQVARARPEPLTRYDPLAWVMFPWKTWKALRSQIRSRLERTARTTGSRPRQARPVPGTVVATGKVPVAVAPVSPAGTNETVPATVTETGETGESFGPETYPKLADAARAAAALLRSREGREVSPAEVATYLSAHGRPGTHARRVSAPLQRDPQSRLHLVAQTEREATG
jgi:Protein of unknown function (DUF2637)